MDYTSSHELTHTLEAVQDSAPHSDGNGHSTEENDLMSRSGNLINRGSMTAVDREGDDYRPLLEPWLT